MKKIGLVLFGILITGVYGKTADQLKADLASIMPAGKKARLVWQQGGTWTTGASKDLYCVDSDDGVIRKLTSTSVDAINPFLTSNGSRVVFSDNLSGRIHVIGFDGKNLATVKNSGKCYKYWNNPTDGSEWVIAGQANGGPFTKINIDSKLELPVYNSSPSVSGSPTIGISKDGTKFSAYFERSSGWDPGVATIPNGTPVFSAKKGGCGMGMAPDNSYDYFVHWSRLANGHHGIQFYNGTQAKDTFTVDEGINAWAHANNNANENTCHDNDEFQNAHMTNDRNFITFSMFNTKANPFIVRLSDRKWIHIDDMLGCTYTHGMDVCFYAPTSILTKYHNSSVVVKGHATYHQFTLEGKKIPASNAPNSRVKGVVITAETLNAQGTVSLR